MTTQEVVLQYFREAELPPSAIDNLLGIPRGRSHDLIVCWWAEDKARARRKKGEESATSEK